MARGFVGGRLAAVLGAMGLVLAMHASSRAQPSAPPPVILTLSGEEAPDTVSRMVEALAREGRQVEIRIAGTAAATKTGAAEPAPKSAATAETTIDAFAEHIIEGIDYGTASVPRIGELRQDWDRAWRANQNGTSGLSAATRIGVVVVLALMAAGAFRLASAGWFRRKMQPASATFTARLVAASWGLIQDGTTILLALMVARLCRNIWLPAADLSSVLLTTLANGAAIGAVYAAVGRFLLAPGADQRRLMPLPRAERHFRLLLVYAVVTPAIIVVLLLAGRVGSGPHALAGLLLLSGLVAVLFKLWWFHDMRRDLAALILGGSEAPGPWRRLIALAAPWFYMASAVALWAVGRAAAMMPDGGRWAEAAALTQTAIVIIPILAVGIGSFVDCRAARRAVTTGATPSSMAAGAAFRAAAVGVLWAAGFYFVARLWADLLVGMSTAQFAIVSRQAAGVAIFAFVGWVALVFLRVFFDACVPKRRAPGLMEEGAEPEAGVPSRLATVLPVLRGVVLGAVLGVTILIVLSRMGVDIGPLLAGFGILGLAISFGSQALVRDIVSGVFFMLEDAFRVGEYVDTGRLKGTVEKISLRSMQLRHQSGQIHTIPFGQIQQLTNASRDWATIKFNVRLDHSADIEQARKTIKKVGLALLEDPEFGPHFIAQLKMQGVADITDSAVVIRLKFTAKPAQASALQREALKRVYGALNQAKVPFASNLVTVRGGEGGSAANAAATAGLPLPGPLASAGG